MDRTQPGCNLFRGFATIFLFSRARNFRRHGSHLGNVFLQLRAVEYLRWPFVHAGRSFAQLGADRFVFLSALDRQWTPASFVWAAFAILLALLIRFADCDYWRVTSLSRLAKVALNFLRQPALWLFAAMTILPSVA